MSESSRAVGSRPESIGMDLRNKGLNTKYTRKVKGKKFNYMKCLITQQTASNVTKKNNLLGHWHRCWSLNSRLPRALCTVLSCPVWRVVWLCTPLPPCLASILMSIPLFVCKYKRSLKRLYRVCKASLFYCFGPICGATIRFRAKQCNVAWQALYRRQQQLGKRG